MGDNWKYYDVDGFNKRKREQGNTYRIPPRANFLLAANYIKNFLDGKKFNWAAMGGLAMLCLGSRREMLDIHIVYDDRDFQRIRAKLEGDQRYVPLQQHLVLQAYGIRVRLPKGMNSLFPSKLLIATGPKYNDAGCTENAEVEVDLVPPGESSKYRIQGNLV